MAELWPRLWHIRFSHDPLSPSSYATALLSDSSYRALLRLVSVCAAGMVWTYTEPSDGSLPADDASLARLCGVSKGRWKKLRAELEPFFKKRAGRWHLKEPWIEIDDRPFRAAIPEKVRELVAAREGRCCTYCGRISASLHYDHILPVSRGGTNDPSNLTLACEPCNLSKGAKTLREWRG